MKNPFQSLEAVAKEFDGASDCATAVVGGAFLDEILAELLREFFVPDSASDKKVFEGTGPLATFSAKIEIAYRLGLISAEEHKMIHGVRGIRNEFAHELNDASFDNQSISDRCKNMEIPIAMVAPKKIPLSEAGENPHPATIEKANRQNSKAIFQETIITLMHILGARFSEANLIQRVSPEPFTAAHEPAERLIANLKKKIEKYEALAQSAGVSSANNEAAMERQKTLIRVQEFCVQQIKNAHERLSKAD